MQSPDDLTLVNAAKAGDHDALETLLRRHHTRVYALCRRMAGNEFDALDATQESLIAIARGLRRFDGRSKFTTWLYRVTTNACVDELRRRSRRPEPVDPDNVEPATGQEPDPGQTVTTRINIDEALSQLSEDHRAVVVLRDQIGLDYAEISSVLDIPVGTVKSRISRARGELAQHLGNPQRTHGVQGPAT